MRQLFPAQSAAWRKLELKGISWWNLHCNVDPCGPEQAWHLSPSTAIPRMGNP